MFSSCSKDNDEQLTTYTLTCDTSISWDVNSVILFEYDKNNDKIYNNSIKIGKGQNMTFTASPNAVKIKVYINGQWVQQVFPLIKGGHIVIRLRDNTLIGSEEP